MKNNIQKEILAQYKTRKDFFKILRPGHNHYQYIWFLTKLKKVDFKLSELDVISKILKISISKLIGEEDNG